MYLSNTALLCSIFMVMSESADYCITGAHTSSDQFTGQGEYVATGSVYNGEPSYQLNGVGEGCSSTYLYIRDGTWYVGPQLGGSYYIRCSSTTTLPSDCTQWEQSDNTFENIQVISGECPSISCSNFKVTGSYVSICNGIFVRNDRNSYVNADNSITYFFNDIKEKWYCSNTDGQTNACSISGIYSQQQNEGFTSMSDGNSNSILMDNGNTATFECGVSTPSPTTPSPTPAIVAGGFCVQLPTNYIDSFSSTGQYEPDGTYNGYPRYKSSCSSNRYIVYYSSGYGYLIANGNGDNIGISTFYSQCTDNVNNLEQCNWSNSMIVSDEYNECSCSSQSSASDIEPISFPIDSINNNNNKNIDTFSLFDITSISILTCIFVVICIFGIAICSYGLGFSNGQKASTYKNISVHDDDV